MPDGDNFVSNRAPPCPKCGADNPSIGVDWDPKGLCYLWWCTECDHKWKINDDH